MFSAVAAQMFGDVLEAGKVMGLAPYGQATYPVEDFFRIEDGRFVFTNTIADWFTQKAKWPIHQDLYQNLAASVQNALEAALYHLVRRLFELSSTRNFCYTGGVALNSVANDKLIRDFKITSEFIQPEAEDSGTSIGAAFHGYWLLNGQYPRPRRLVRDERGKRYSPCEVERAIERAPRLVIERPADVIEETVSLLREGKIIGLCQGGSELGPRALGHRSILCDPRIPDAKDILNRKVKHREAFRPFAPAILADKVHDWFETDEASFEAPFMLRVCPFRADKRHLLPAVTHVDGTGRVQTVTEQSDPFFYRVLREFYLRTGVPILINTSFNIMGEPIVETPEDALWCLLGTDIDVVVFEQCLVKKPAGYTSILDLVPYITAKRYTMHYLTEEGQIGARVSGREAFVSYAVDTPWGEVRQVTGAALLSLLQLIDGHTSGRELLESVASLPQIGPLDYTGCIKRWESAVFGPSEQMLDYTQNSSRLVDQVVYPRMAASLVHSDSRLPRTERELQRVLLRLRRAGIISFRNE